MLISSSDSFYDILQVGRDASPSEIRTSFLRLAGKYHPDLFHGDAETYRPFKLIRRAYEVLSDPIQRTAYDENPAPFHAQVLASLPEAEPIITPSRPDGQASFEPHGRGHESLLKNLQRRRSYRWVQAVCVSMLAAAVTTVATVVALRMDQTASVPTQADSKPVPARFVPPPDTELSSLVVEDPSDQKNRSAAHEHELTPTPPPPIMSTAHELDPGIADLRALPALDRTMIPDLDTLPEVEPLEVSGVDLGEVALERLPEFDSIPFPKLAPVRLPDLESVQIPELDSTELPMADTGSGFSRSAWSSAYSSSPGSAHTWPGAGQAPATVVGPYRPTMAGRARSPLPLPIPQPAYGSRPVPTENGWPGAQQPIALGSAIGMMNSIDSLPSISSGRSLGSLPRSYLNTPLSTPAIPSVNVAPLIDSDVGTRYLRLPQQRRGRPVEVQTGVRMLLQD